MLSHALDPFTNAYLEAALWSEMDESTPEGGEPFDENYSLDDLAPETIASAVNDCASFQETNAADLADMDPAHAGHDFLLTRNRHGAGFWDRGLGKLGTRLTDASHAYGSWGLYLGDDGKIYSHG